MHTPRPPESLIERAEAAIHRSRGLCAELASTVEECRARIDHAGRQARELKVVVAIHRQRRLSRAQCRTDREKVFEMA
jgi:hypothetical protein